MIGLERHIRFFLLCLLVFPAGCSHLSRERISLKYWTPNLPEQIVLCPEVNPFKHSKVAVFSFKAPFPDNGVGKAAAEAVYNDLLQKGVFDYVSNETSHHILSMRNSLETAQSEGYDLMITGEILDYLDGSELLSSRVTEKIHVVHVASRRILWVAVARSLSEPDPSNDYLLFQTRGRAADPARTLIKENANKFGNLMLLKPMQTDAAETRKDIMLSAHQAVFDELSMKVDELNNKNNELGTKLTLEAEKSHSLGREVDELRFQNDQLEEKLKEELEKGELRLKRDQERTIVKLDDRICFDPGSDVLKKKAKETLDKLSKVLADIPDGMVHIKGHTDDLPIGNHRFASNWELSSARAVAVLRYLSDHGRIAPERLSATGCGEYQPIVPNNSLENRRLNRRVDIVIEPNISELPRNANVPGQP